MGCTSSSVATGTVEDTQPKTIPKTTTAPEISDEDTAAIDEPVVDTHDIVNDDVKQFLKIQKEFEKTLMDTYNSLHGKQHRQQPLSEESLKYWYSLPLN